MNETPVTTDLSGNQTENAVGERTIQAKTTGHQRMRFTAVFSCLAEGMNLSQ